MLYNKINIMVPTYHRHDTKLTNLISSLINTVVDKEKVVITFCVNDSDIDTINYIKNANIPFEHCVVIEDTKIPHLAYYYNLMYEQTAFKDELTLVSMIGDDMRFDTLGWESIVLRYVNYFDGLCIVYCDDCFHWHERLCVNLFTTRKFVGLQEKPFMCEGFPCDGIDIVWQRVAEHFGRAIYVEQVKIIHDHATRDILHRDPVWDRLRIRCPEVEDFIINHLDKYVADCISNIKNNLPKDTDYDIPVLMTTCDRVYLLSITVKTLIGASSIPKEVYVYDDRSQRLSEVKEIVDQIPGVTFYESDQKLTHTKKVPTSIGNFFSRTNHDYVFVIDSDTIFSKYWYLYLKILCGKLLSRDNLGYFSLFTPKVHDGELCDQNDFCLHGMYERKCVGGFGVLITRKFYYEYLSKASELTDDWDNRMAALSVSAGRKIYSPIVSFIQHSGHSEGVHVGPDGTYSDNFIGNDATPMSVSINESVNNQDVLVSIFCGISDIIQATIVVNSVLKTGRKVTIVTIPVYSEFMSMLCPAARVIIADNIVSRAANAHNTSTSYLRTAHKGFRYYINLQPDSPENQNSFSMSGFNTLAWMTNKIERVMGGPLIHDKDPGLNISKRLASRGRGSSGRQTVVICSENYDILSDQRVLNILNCPEDPHNSHRKNSLIKFISPNRTVSPSFSGIKIEYLNRLSFKDMVAILASESNVLYIGDDTDYLWFASFARCKKIIARRGLDVSRIDSLSYYDKDVEVM